MPLPHGPLEKLEDNLWRVEGTIAGAPIKRVMTLARLRDGRVVVYSAIALEEELMKEIEAWGTPAILVVPNSSHRLDARVYKDRYRGITVVAPAAAKKRVEEVVKVDATSFEGDDTVRFRSVDGTRDRDALLEVRSGDRVTIVLNDVVMNMRRLPGFGGLVLALIGFTGARPKVTPAAKLFLMPDKKAVKADLLRMAETPGLARVIVSHGEMLVGDAAGALRIAAASL